MQVLKTKLLKTQPHYPTSCRNPHQPKVYFCQSSHANYFSKFDLAKGYWQVSVTKTDRHKLAFSTPDAVYQWCVMPFDPAKFTECIHLYDS